MITRRNSKRTDWGTEDYYRFYRKSGGKLLSKPYHRILRDINTAVMEEVTEGYVLKLPERCGVIFLYGIEAKDSIVDGKFTTNRGIDYKATKQMWKDYPETKEQGKVVRYLNKHTNGYTYKIAYSKMSSQISGRVAYTFRINRRIKRLTAQKIFNGFIPERLYNSKDFDIKVIKEENKNK